MAAVLACCGKKETPQPAKKPGSQSGVAAGPVSGANSEAPPAGFAKVGSPEDPEGPEGHGLWVEEKGAGVRYPPEFDKLTPEAQKAWHEAKYKIPLSTDFIEHFPRHMQATWIERWANAPDDEAYEKRRKAEDRAELVRPVARGFKPENVRRKIKLTLIPKSARIRVGESLWYLLEMRNVGHEAIEFRETSKSFWKVGNSSELKYHFYVTPPGGKETRVNFRVDSTELMGNRPEEIVIPESLGKDEARKYFEQEKERRGMEKARLFTLWVELQPGETLVARPWKFVSRRERQKSIAGPRDDYMQFKVEGPFREARLDPDEFKFDQPGTYRVKVVYNHNPFGLKPPTEEEIQKRIAKWGLDREYQMRRHQERVAESLGIVESNTVVVEVYP